ncbi:MAG: STAS domain-containing protein [Leptospirales bacterium]|nr:STAS domain-containing protein [Leptospirales bacterium]
MEMLAEERENAVIVRLAGEIDLYNAPDLRQLLSEQIRKGNTRIVLDMNRISYVDSSGLGVLISATTEATKRGGGLKLVSLSQNVRAVIDLVRLNAMFPVYSSENDAMSAFPA